MFLAALVATLAMASIALADANVIYTPLQSDGTYYAPFSPGQERTTVGFADRKLNAASAPSGTYPPNRPFHVYLYNTGGTVISGSLITGVNYVEWGPAGSWWYAKSACKVPSPYSHRGGCLTFTRGA